MSDKNYYLVVNQTMSKLSNAVNSLVKRVENMEKTIKRYLFQEMKLVAETLTKREVIVLYGIYTSKEQFVNVDVLCVQVKILKNKVYGLSNKLQNAGLILRRKTLMQITQKGKSVVKYLMYKKDYKHREVFK